MEEDEYEEDFEGTETHQYYGEGVKALDSAPSPPLGHRSGPSRDAIVELLGEEAEIERIDSYLETHTQENSTNPMHALKQAQKENTALRMELKQMSDRLDQLLDLKTAKASKVPRAALSAPSLGNDQQLRTALKKLQTIKKERNKLYEKLKRLVDPGYAAALTQDVTDLGKKLDRLQRQNRSKSQGQRGREKSLERLAREDEVSTAMKAVIEERGSIKALREKVAVAEEEIERMASALVNMEEREEELIGKQSALQAEAGGVSVASEGKRKKQAEELTAARDACKRELGAAVLSSDTQVKKLSRREAELQLELSAHQEELKRLSRELAERQQILDGSKRNLEDLTEITAGTDMEPLVMLRRVRAKSRDTSLPSEDNVPRSTKSSEPGSREVRPDFRVRSRPVQSQSSKSLTNQTAPKPPLKPKGRPRPFPRPLEEPEFRQSPAILDQPLAQNLPDAIDPLPDLPTLAYIPVPELPTIETTDKGELLEEPLDARVPLQPSNPYEKAAEALLPAPVESPPQSLFRPAHPPVASASLDSDSSSPMHGLPPLKLNAPRDRSHLLTQEEASNPPPKALMERKCLKQRSIQDSSNSRTDELAKKAEEKHSFFDPEDSDQFADVQKQLVAVRSEKREPTTQQVVVQYRLHPHELEEQDLT